ncbi:MAG: hypothetical protein KKB03_04155 [Nanoarchaeota archaeon]|nr:hypothetical protein [Nanoarchaeota archaeon]MBU2520407.1 hypothetical protein [Nanoarchaeota archaeon]
MQITMRKGFIVADSNKPGPTYVAPHAAVAFYKLWDNQDHGTHYIAFGLAKNGGKALISTITRERNLGIDFFRQEPIEQLALENYVHFQENPTEGTKEFRKKYAWVARNSEEHSFKSRIYNNFWTDIKKTEGPILFIHRQFLNPIRHPSIIDVVPFNFETETKQAVQKLNERYSNLFRSLFPFYKEMFNFKSKWIEFKYELERVSDFNIKLFEGKKPLIARRIRKFHEKTIRQPYLEITQKRNFKGTPIKPIIKKDFLSLNVPILHLEVSEFLSKRFPEIAVHLIRDLLKEIEKK